MKAEEIETAEDLMEWLRGLPKGQVLQVAPQIAHRVAMRVLPVWADHCTKLHQDNSTDITVFWCHTLNTVAVGKRSVLSDDVMRAAHKAACDTFAPTFAAAYSAKTAAVNAVFFAAHRTADAALGAIHAVGAAYAVALNAAAVNAIATNAIAAYTADAIAVERDEDLLVLPLWPEGADPLAEGWARAAPLFARHPAWVVFKDLYENTLHARPQNWPLLTALAQKDEAFWTGTDTEVLDRIAEVMEGFGPKKADRSSLELPPDEFIDRAIKSQPSATTSEITAVKQAISAIRSELPATFDEIIGMVALEIKRLQGINYVSDEHRDICLQQIRTLSVIHRSIERLREAFPEGEIADQDAEKILPLGRVIADHCKAWPRNNAEEMVDTTYRLAIVGGLSGLLLGIGVPIAVGAGICTAALFGQKTVKLLVDKTQAN